MQDLSKCKILVVDDLKTNQDILTAALGKNYSMVHAYDAETGLRLIKEERPDLILLDIMMPGIDGYEACRRIKSDPESADIPIIFLSALTELENKAKGFKCGAVDYIIKPFEIIEVRERVRTHLSLRVTRLELDDQISLLDRKVRERTQELEITRDVMLESLASLTEYRDSETGMHIQRTKEYIRVLAEELKAHPRYREYMTGEMIGLISKVAPLHDIGKVGVPDFILLKPSRLTQEEFNLMKLHTVYGYKTLLRAEERIGESHFLKVAQEIVHSHHEKYDGTGYPLGLKGEDIPIPGRLMSIADVYDALISPRVYKAGFPHEEAVEIILKGDDITDPAHFCPVVLDAFTNISDRFYQISQEFADTHQKA